MQIDQLEGVNEIASQDEKNICDRLHLCFDVDLDDENRRSRKFPTTELRHERIHLTQSYSIDKALLFYCNQLCR